MSDKKVVMKAFNDWAWKKSGDAIGVMDGQDAAREAWLAAEKLYAEPSVAETKSLMSDITAYEVLQGLTKQAIAARSPSVNVSTIIASQILSEIDEGAAALSALKGVTGGWRHTVGNEWNGYLLCGTLRVAREDFDTQLSTEFRKETFDAIVSALNAYHGAMQNAPTFPDEPHIESDDDAVDCSRLRDQADVLSERYQSMKDNRDEWKAYSYTVRIKLEKAHRDSERLNKWVADLQSGMYVNCVYCGHRYGPNETTPTSMADALKTHIESCPQHPMSELKRIVAEHSVKDHFRERVCEALGEHVDTEDDRLLDAILALRKQIREPDRITICATPSDCIDTKLALDALMKKQFASLGIAQGPQTAPFANCKYRYCDFPGQCRSEGRCHHPNPKRDSLGG